MTKPTKDPHLEEIYRARLALVGEFGSAEEYCDDVIRRSRERVQRGEVFSGETHDVENPGQGEKPWEDPVVKELHEIRERLADRHRTKKAA
jgi:hypothetical protein